MTNELKERKSNWWTESSPCVSRDNTGTNLCDPGMWCALSAIPDLGKWARETRGAKEGSLASLLTLMTGLWRMLVNPAHAAREPL